jgi:drug/metabolite transporter (DMT)-like permease
MPARARFAPPPATLGFLCAATGALGFSIKAILVKYAYRFGVDPETLLAMRMLYALPFFVAMAAFTSLRSPRPLTWHDWRELVMLGFFGYYLASYADFLGLQYISAALERVIVYTYPAIVVLLVSASRRHWPGRQMLLALAVSYVGVALAVWHDAHGPARNLPLGASLVFVSALSFAVYLWRCGTAITRLGATRVTALATGVACLMTVGQFAVLRPLASLPGQPWQVQTSALAMAVFSTVLPIWLNSQAIRLLGASRTAIISSLGPVFTLLLAWGALAEPVTASVLAGAVLVVVGVRWIARFPAQ